MERVENKKKVIQLADGNTEENITIIGDGGELFKAIAQEAERLHDKKPDARLLAEYEIEEKSPCPTCELFAMARAVIKRDAATNN